MCAGVFTDCLWKDTYRNNSSEIETKTKVKRKFLISAPLVILHVRDEMKVCFILKEIGENKLSEHTRPHPWLKKGLWL